MASEKKTLILQIIILNSLKKYTIFIVFSFLTLFSGSISGQGRSIFGKTEQPSKSGGQIKIVQDNSIRTAVEKYQWNQSKEQTITGFRIRIFSNSGPNAKNEFENARASFSDMFNIRVYEEFQYPFYKIYVGDFRTRSDAMKMLVLIEKSFPDAFIVQTKINYPKLSTE
jgi:hypothetical protein